jgi:glucose-6-phosphate 1-epimerase
MVRYPDGARLEKGPGGLERLALDATEGEALIYLHGGHVAAFRPKGAKPVLWMSAASRFEAGSPIRGGVPICFPWFGRKAGSPDAPPHGFARILPWTIGSVALGPDGRLRAVLELSADAALRGGFARELSLSLAVTVGRSLEMELTARNVHSADVTFEEALHAYFAVSDARQIRIRGLEGAPYLDAAAAMARKPGETGPIAIVAETDRVYGATSASVTIEDPAWRRRIVVAKSGSRTTVVWNPWVAKAKAMPDFGDEEWTGMLCVETANAKDDAVTLAPGASRVMTAMLEVEAG